jgi:hypothetical protein
MGSAAAVLSLAVATHPLVIEPADRHTCVAGTHSRTADGRIVCWSVPVPAVCAVDAEMVTQPVPAALSRRWAIADPATFWPRWTATETVAKLVDVPVVVWLRRFGLVDSGGDAGPGGRVALQSRIVGDLVVTQGVLLPAEQPTAGRRGVRPDPTVAWRSAGRVP